MPKPGWYQFHIPIGWEYYTMLLVSQEEKPKMTSRTYIIIACMVCLVVLACESTYAIPAFARREGVQCQMCHFRLPELNEDGHAYLRRGLREEPGDMTEEMGQMGEMPEEEQSKTPTAATSRPLGVPLPLSWADYLTVMGHHMFVAQKNAKAEFDAGMIDVWAAGPLNLHWSGLANPSFDIQNGGSDVDQAYGQYITRWTEQFGSVRFGQMYPFAILFNQGGPSMPLSTPVVLSTSGDTGNAWTPVSVLRGVEIGAVDLPHWNAYLGAAQPQPETGESTHAEGGISDAGMGSDQHIDLYASSEFLFGKDGNSLTLYGYWGKADLPPAGDEHSFHRVGVFGNIYGSSTKGVVGYLTGKDDTVDGRSLDNSGYFLLAE